MKVLAEPSKRGKRTLETRLRVEVYSNSKPNGESLFVEPRNPGEKPFWVIEFDTKVLSVIGRRINARGLALKDINSIFITPRTDP